MPLPLIFGALLGGLLLWLAHATWKSTARRQAARRSYFNKLAPLFDRFELRPTPHGLPRATAWRGQDAFDLQAIPDALTYRKLPALWVMVTLPGPMPVAATLDLMARPSGQEPFSRFASLPHALPRPDFLPEEVSTHSDNPAGVPPQDLIARHSALFHDGRLKELVIAPNGLRLVILAEEADRTRFLIYRDAETGKTPLPSRRIAPLLDALLALRDDLHFDATRKDAA